MSVYQSSDSALKIIKMHLKGLALGITSLFITCILLQNAKPLVSQTTLLEGY